LVQTSIARYEDLEGVVVWRWGMLEGRSRGDRGLEAERGRRWSLTLRSGG